MNWPNFFVVGAHKAGTTSLYVHLKPHPEVFLPSLKEPRYFTPEVRGSVGLEEYRALYEGADGYKAIGDVTPFYLPSEGAPGRIREASPDAKIVIMLRDPVERAFSHYLYARQIGEEPAGSFRDALRRYQDRQAKEWYLSREYIEHGLYWAQVRRYLETFGSDQVLVLMFADLVKNPNDLMSRIARHIGVDPEFFAGADVSEARNPYQMPKFGGIRALQRWGVTRLFPRSVVLALRPLFFDQKKPALDEESRRYLQDLYAPDVSGLEELLGRNLPALRMSWAPAS